MLTAACQAPQVVSTPTDAKVGRLSEESGKGPDKSTSTIFFTSNGWHSSIVIPRKNLTLGTLPEAADFPIAPYLSFGWGDAEYYPARKPNFDMTLRAAFQPTPSVVHLSGLRSHPKDVFPKDEVVDLQISTDGLRQLIGYLDRTFARVDAKRASSIAPGLHAFSHFYRANGTFHLFNTCNTWTARGLQAAGWPIQVSGVVAAEELMAQVRQLAERQMVLPE